MIIIHEVKVNPQGNININIETGVGYIITSAKLWTKDTFQDETLAKDFETRLSQVNNKEIFILTPGEVNLASFSGIHFLEFKTNQPDEDEDCTDCGDIILISVTDFSEYYRCMADYILKASVCASNLFSSEVCNSSEVTKAMTLNLLSDTVLQCLELGQLEEAIQLINKMDKLCDKCSNCNKSTSLKRSNCTSCNSYY